MHAVRNISLCTKDCLCLYVCPTGATNTETGQIDASKCLEGCRACVDACPSHAIFLLPEIFPQQRDKDVRVKNAVLALMKSKIVQEEIADYIIETNDKLLLLRLKCTMFRTLWFHSVFMKRIWRESTSNLEKKKRSFSSW